MFYRRVFFISILLMVTGFTLMDLHLIEEIKKLNDKIQKLEEKTR